MGALRCFAWLLVLLASRLFVVAVPSDHEAPSSLRSGGGQENRRRSLLVWNWLWGAPRGSDSITYRVMDAMTRVPSGSFRDSRYLPRTVWERTFDCLQQESTEELNLLGVANSGFESFLELSRTEENWAQMDGWIEDALTPLTKTNETIPGGTATIIAEPCNTISNLAVYRSLYAMCDRTNKGPNWSIRPVDIRALVQSFNVLGFTSMFLHSSILANVQRIYNLSRDVLGLAMYQALVNGFGPSNVIIDNLQNSTLQFTGVQAAEELSRVFVIAQDASEWEDLASNITLPQFSKAFAAIGIFAAFMAFPDFLAEPGIDAFAGLLVSISEGREFVLQQLKPAIREALESKNVQISFLNRIKLAFGLVGTLIKTVSRIDIVF